MSDVLGSDEFPETGSDALNVALVAFTGCVGEAFRDAEDEADRICSYGLTIGETYVPFDPDPEDDCEDDEAVCSQLWVRVMNVTPQAVNSWGGDCATSLDLDIEVGVIRCIEMPEDGEAPLASNVLAAALQAASDMNRVFCAAMACEVWEKITSNQWTPMGPLGGQHGGIWTFTVSV